MAGGTADDAGRQGDLEVVLRGTNWLAALAALGYRDVARADDISWVQLRDLVLLTTGSADTVSALARHTGVAVSSASRTVDRLIAAGLVERTAVVGDRRRVRLSPSAGRAAACWCRCWCCR